METEFTVKIKYDIGFNETVNTPARVVRPTPEHAFYQIYFSDGVSYDKHCIFDTKRRCFRAAP
jgi:hypothetical protein